MFLVGKKACLVGVGVMVAFLGGCAPAVCSQKIHREAKATSRVPILLYHHVRDLPDSAKPLEKRWSVALQKFDAQMKWLAEQGYHPMTLERMAADLKHGRPLPDKPIVLTFDDGWKDQYEGAFPILKKYRFVATFFIITDAVGHSAYMDWEQIKELAVAGMDVQSHSLSHERLSTMPGFRARQEIRESKRVMEDHLNKPITILAYPYGSYDDDVIAEVKAAGFDAAVAIGGRNGGYLFRADQTYTLVRYGIEGNDNLPAIARRKGF